MDFSVLIGKMFIFVALMSIGYMCARKKYISHSFITDASKLTLNVFMVSTIVYTVVASDMSMSAKELMLSLGVMTLTIGLCYVVGGVLSRVLPMPKDRRPVYELLIGAMNTMFIALPVVQQTYGNTAVFHISLSCLPFNLLIYSYGIYRLNSGDAQFKLKIKSIFSPPLVATIAAIVLFFLKLPVPAVIKDLLGTMSSVTMPLSMLVVGASLGSVKFLDAFKEKSAYIVALVSLIVCPLLIWALLSLFVSDPILLKSAVICAASPSGIIVTVLSVQYKKDFVYSSKAIFLSVVLSMVTLPLFVYLLG